MKITESSLKRMIKEEVSMHMKAADVASQLSDIVNDPANTEAIYYMFEKHWPGMPVPSQTRKIAEQFNRCIQSCAYGG